MIRELVIDNFKCKQGERYEYEFSGTDVFVGPNGAGKSRIVDSIEFLFTGQLKGKSRNADIYKDYGNGLPFTVTAQVKDETITRTIKPVPKKDGTTSFTSTVEVYVDDRLYYSGKEANEYLQQFVLPVVFDYSKLLSMNTSERLKVFLELLGYEKASMEDIVKCFNGKEVDSKVKDIDGAIKYAEDETKYFNRKQKESSGAKAFNTKLKSGMDGNVKDLKVLQEELDELKKEQETVKEDIRKATEIENEYEANKKRIKDLNESLVELMALDYDSAIKETADKIVKCDKLIKELKQDKSSEITSKLEDIQKVADKLNPLVISINDQYNERTLLKEKETTKLELINSISEFKGICPLAEIECSGDLTKGLQKAKDELDAIRLELVSCASVIEALEEQRDKLFDEDKSLRDDLQELKESNKDILKWNSDQDTINETAKKRKEVLQAEANQLNVDLAGHDAECKKIREEISLISGYVYDDYEPIENMKTYLGGLAVQVIEKKEAIKTLEEKQNTIKAQHKAIIQHDKDVQEWEEWKEVVKSLKSLKRQCMLSKLNPIKDAVDTVLATANKPYTFEFILNDTNGKDILDFGWKDKDGSVKVALSSGEHLLTSIGMLHVMQKNFKLSLFMIHEVMLLDDDNLETLLGMHMPFDNVVLLSPRMLPASNYKSEII